MKKTLLISGVLLALMGSVASAGGVNLAWNDCLPAGAQDMTFLCNTNSGAPFQLYASFTPNVDMVDLVANEWVIDLESAGAALPAWWSMKGTVDPAGRCRDASLAMTTNFRPDRSPAPTPGVATSASRAPSTALASRDRTPRGSAVCRRSRPPARSRST